MIQINNGYKDYYYLVDGKIYNKKTNRYIKADSRNQIKLTREDGTTAHTTLNRIYKAVYGCDYAIDNTDSFDGEQWKQIKAGYPYFISSFGRVKSNVFQESKILKPSIESGYARIKLDLGEGLVNYSIHKLVYFTFNDKQINPFLECHHLDGNPLNNMLNNIVYLTHEQHLKAHKLMNQENKSNE